MAHHSISSCAARPFDREIPNLANHSELVLLLTIRYSRIDTITYACPARTSNAFAARLSSRARLCYAGHRSCIDNLRHCSDSQVSSLLSHPSTSFSLSLPESCLNSSPSLSILHYSFAHQQAIHSLLIITSFVYRFCAQLSRKAYVQKRPSLGNC